MVIGTGEVLVFDVPPGGGEIEIDNNGQTINDCQCHLSKPGRWNAMIGCLRGKVGRYLRRPSVANPRSRKPSMANRTSRALLDMVNGSRLAW